MSTTRSLTIGRFPIAEITGTCPASTIGSIRGARQVRLADLIGGRRRRVDKLAEVVELVGELTTGVVGPRVREIEDSLPDEAVLVDPDRNRESSSRSKAGVLIVGSCRHEL